MFELEDYSSGLHDGLLSKYSDLTSPALDFYITDSLQDMLDVDIRSEIASVVGNGIGNDLSSMLNDLPSSLDHAMDVISSINNNNSTSNSFTNHLNLNNTSINNNSSSLSSSGGSTWMGPSWSSSSTNNNDYYVDLGACVNPISVMPLISSSIMRSASSLANLNSASTPAFPNSPTHGNETNKSHLTFSPAQMKAGSIRHEQISSHIPKQIVSISSAVTAGTTAPATMATNAGLQRKLNRQQVQAVSVDGVKKDLQNIVSYNDIKSQLNNSTNGGIIINNETRQNISADSATNTIKLAPGIGGLTFANSLTYNKIKQQTIIKSSSGSPLSTNNANNNIVVKKERDSSPLRMSNMNGNKVVARQSFTPKSIAITAHAMRASSPAQSISMSPSSSHSSSSNSSLGTSPSNATNNIFTTSFVNNNNSAFQNMNGVNVKTLQQKVKVLTTDSEFPKPAYSYSCLIAMALKNSRSGSLPVSEIYSFMCEHFPYFKTAPSGWKNSVRHNLSLNKCFEKIEKPATNNNQRKGCLWAMNPDRIAKMDDEVLKWSRKDPKAIRRAMVHPEHLEALERGEMKHGSTGDSDMELDSQSEIEEASDLEEPEVDDLLIDNCLVEEAGEEDHEHEFGVEGGFPEIDDTEQLTNDQQTLVNEIVESMETPNLSQSTSASRDFDIEVDDIYDAIDIEDDKSMLNIKLEDDIIEIGPADLEMNALTPTTKHQQQLQQQFVQQKQQQQQRSSPTVVVSVADFQSAKRARLSYTTQQQQQQQQTPQSALQRQQFLNKQQLLQLQQQMKQQQILQQANSTVSLRKVKVLQQITKSQPQTNQHVVVHTLANTTPTVSFVSANNINNNMHVRNNSGFLQFSTLQQSQPQQQQQLQRRKIQMSNRIVENN